MVARPSHVASRHSINANAGILQHLSDLIHNLLPHRPPPLRLTLRRTLGTSCDGRCRRFALEPSNSALRLCVLSPTTQPGTRQRTRAAGRSPSRHEYPRTQPMTAPKSDPGHCNSARCKVIAYLYDLSENVRPTKGSSVGGASDVATRYLYMCGTIA